MKRDEIMQAVLSQLRSELPLNGMVIQESDPLVSLPESDSVHLMRVAAQLERRFSVEFHDERLFAAKTVGDLIGLVEHALSTGQAR